MENYRWPGYAIEGGVLYEAAGCDEEDGIVQRWRQIEKVSGPTLLVLLTQMELEVPSRRCRFSNLPSDGRILEDKSKKKKKTKKQASENRGGEDDES